MMRRQQVTIKRQCAQLAICGVGQSELGQYASVSLINDERCVETRRLMKTDRLDYSLKENSQKPY